MATENKKNSSINLQVGEKPPLANHDSSVLDLAFAMDVTSSMGSYIDAAQQSIRLIVEEIIAGEKSDIRMALVEYRDHPPQDDSFVTRTHGFTDSVKSMKSWLDASSADGGGDTPEAVADALHDVLKLDWRPEATKICVLISDAPPHGLTGGYDGFPDGCPAGNDPVVIINQMAEKNITVYSVGCEPSINDSRDFYMALAHITGGQYVPLNNAKMLAKVIIGGAQEEITLQRLMEDVHQEVINEMETRGGAEEMDEDLMALAIHEKLKAKGAKTKALYRNNVQLEEPSEFAQKMSGKGSSMSDWKAEWKASGRASSEPVGYSACDDLIDDMSEMAMCCDAPMAPMAFRGGPPAGAPPPPMAAYCSAPMDAELNSTPEAEESYQVVDADLNLAQAKRMVKRSIAMNKVNFKK